MCLCGGGGEVRDEVEGGGGVCRHKGKESVSDHLGMEGDGVQT